jgi:ABC-type cobalamin/Fe3+-siderophores transport system ATPase subunit
MAARYATHALLLHDGRGVSGRVDEVLTPDHLSRVYGVHMTIDRNRSGAVTVQVAAREDAS